MKEFKLMEFEKFIPNRLVFGSGCTGRIHSMKLPGKKALLVISNGRSTKANGSLARIQNELDLAGVSHVLFDKVEANPLNSTVRAGVQAALDNACDFIVALGGGSVMDAAKAMAIVVTNGGDYWDYIMSGSGGKKPVTRAPLPLVCITTTAGTGSETDRGAVISNPDTREKVGLKTEALYPVLSFVDPELMVSVPPAFTAYQGWDALSHNMEGYISTQANIMSDVFALPGVEHVGRHLARAVRNGADLEAREHVALGNSLAGMLMCVGGVGSQHSLEDALSAFHHDLPHGAGLILLSKAYFQHFIDRHVCDDRFIRMAQALGMEDASDPQDFITMLDRLQKDCGVDSLKMSDYGITPGEFPDIIRNAKEVSGRLFQFDRVYLEDEDCMDILMKSYR